MYVKEVSIAGIVILEVVALLHGINGTALTLVVALIAGIAGYELKVYRNRGKGDVYDEQPEESQE